jgi:hypothetical protein
MRDHSEKGRVTKPDLAAASPGTSGIESRGGASASEGLAAPSGSSTSATATV